MITSSLANLELPNFAHLATSTIQFEPRDEIFVDNFIVMSQPLFKNTFISGGPKGSFKDSKKLQN